MTDVSGHAVYRSRAFGTSDIHAGHSRVTSQQHNKSGTRLGNERGRRLMSFARKAVTVASVDHRQLEHVVALVYAALTPIDGEETRPGDKLLDVPDMTNLLDTIVSTLKVDADTAGALFIRALALYTFCIKDPPPKEFMEKGIPGELLCAVAAMAAVTQTPGNDGLASHEFAPGAVRRILAAAFS